MNKIKYNYYKRLFETTLHEFNIQALEIQSSGEKIRYHIQQIQNAIGATPASKAISYAKEEQKNSIAQLNYYNNLYNTCRTHLCTAIDEAQETSQYYEDMVRLSELDKIHVKLQDTIKLIVNFAKTDLFSLGNNTFEPGEED